MATSEKTPKGAPSSNLNSKVRQAAFSKFADTMADEEVSVESAESGHTTIKMSMFEADIWDEYESNCRLQLVPPKRKMYFVKWEQLMEQADRVFAKVLKGKIKDDAPVIGNVYGPGLSDRPMARNKDIKQIGMQMLDVNFTGLSKHPKVGDFMLDALKLLNDIGAGKAHPVE